MKKILLLLLFPVALFGQGLYVPAKTILGTVNGYTRPVAGATITVCAASTGGIPCAPALANTVFQDSGLTIPLSNPLFADSSGNYPQFAVAPGSYTITESAAGYTGFSYQLQTSCVPGGGCALASLMVTGSATVGSLIAGSLTVTGTFTGTTFNATTYQVGGVPQSGTGPLVAQTGGVIAPTSVTTGQIIQPAATALTIKDNQGGTRFSIPSGGVAQSTLNNTVIGGGSTYNGTTQNIQKFTSSGTFTIPANVTSVDVLIIGGGGAGGGSTAANNGGGGGSGGYAEKLLSGLTPGNTITVTVGGGGAGSAGANGGAGTASSIASGTQTIATVTANGGSGGQSQAGSVATPGLGGVISTGGDINGFGVNGYFSTAGTIGGAGGSTFLGGGGLGGPNSTGSVAGTNTGSGGGGAGGPGSSSAGGNGAAGIVIFRWVN